MCWVKAQLTKDCTLGIEVPGRARDGILWLRVSPKPLRCPRMTLTTFDTILTDRGSKYAVSGAPVTSKDDALAVLKELKRTKKFARATHNTWAALLDAGPIKNDDGEAGAGMIIVRMLEREGLRNHVVIVTRWYGGKHLGGDRFRHVQDCVSHYLTHRADTG